uniref:F-box protein At1g71320 n=1 Tax=Nicotiana tabacum TaxID=4097 RepID=A0A1S3X6M7_TOBAC|nr:PREDICTED: putative F-box protein At1g71320 [Nicotiana tabacum]
MADLDLPDDITTIVLSNLPVKSLLRFKCVSKPWNSWISSRRRKGAIARISNWNSTLSFRFINQQLTSEKTNDIKLLSCSFMGSCDGLILICRDEHIYLWNPATQFCAKVLELDFLNDDDYYIRAGLCFDSSKNVHKSVLIMHKDFRREFVIVASFKDRDGITVHGRLHYR